MIFENDGFCVACEQDVIFTAKEDWLREFYTCSSCGSLPRHRALINAMNEFIPDWKTKIIHESSPDGASSYFIKLRCENYSQSYFFPNAKLGSMVGENRCENLEEMTFDDESFDVFITQDVFEHILSPDLAFKEIDRVLKPGGMHIFSMPWYPNQKTEFRAKKVGNKIEHLLEPIYHGNPIDESGSLVTVDWGIDFVDYVYRASGMTTMVYLYKNRKLGLDAEFLHIFLSIKH